MSNAFASFFLLFTILVSADARVIQAATYNGHTYLLLDRATWVQAESEAVSLGGHLVTIETMAENDFLVQTFGPTATAFYPTGSVSLWTGLNDAQTEGAFVWASGSASAFTNWALPGEPGGHVSDEDYIGIFISFGVPGKWHDIVSDFRFGDIPLGVVEIPAILSTLAVDVSPRSGPWMYSASLNPALTYGVNDHLPPSSFVVSAGQTITIGATGLADADGALTVFGSTSPDGYPTAILNNGNGSSGQRAPSLFTPFYYPTRLLAVVADFATSTGTVIGTPFEVGAGPLTIMVPSGATRLQIGVNDDNYSDNTGLFNATIRFESFDYTPPLTITRSGSVALLRWPCAAYEWTLDAATNLSVPDWGGIAGPFTPDDGFFLHSVPIDVAQRFYRLHR